MKYDTEQEQLDIYNQLILIKERLTILINSNNTQSEKILTTQEKDFITQSQLNLTMALDAINDAILFTQK